MIRKSVLNGHSLPENIREMLPPKDIQWPQLTGEYQGNASAEGYTLEDGTPLNLSDKDQKWAPLKDTFKF